jgi:hypothetical protein
MQSVKYLEYLSEIDFVYVKNLGNKSMDEVGPFDEKTKDQKSQSSVSQVYLSGLLSKSLFESKEMAAVLAFSWWVSWIIWIRVCLPSRFLAPTPPPTHHRKVRVIFFSPKSICLQGVFSPMSLLTEKRDV